MRVAVIGAGVTGLVCCKYCKELNLEVVVYEQCKDVGGTWVYSTEKEAHSSMYKNLVTNSPIETMGFRDFMFPKCDEESYVTWREVLNFIKSYEKHFGLTECIKFEHKITKVTPIEDNKWKIDGKSEIEEFTEVFDAVFVCNGHFFAPNLPKINGIENFEGEVVHSHDYRDPKMYKDKKVLVIGSGPSGIDITFDLSTLANEVHISHHSTTLASDLFPSNVVQVPDVDFISEKFIYFMDSKKEIYDAIVLCTGYKYTFPFLTDDCGIKTTNNHVTSLYKHVINIKYPTMFFIGLTNVTIFNHIVELQVQFSLKALLKEISLPSKDEMYEELSVETTDRLEKGYRGKKMHQLWPEFMRQYIDTIVNLAKLVPVKPVLLDIYDESRSLSYSDVKKYRTYRYVILNDHEYVKQVRKVVVLKRPTN